jgi:translation initiation factor 2 subunit 2
MTALQADTERKPRKSVAFSEGATIVDSNGDVTESTEMNGGKESAESHSGDATGQHTTHPSGSRD